MTEEVIDPVIARTHVRTHTICTVAISSIGLETILAFSQDF